MALSWQQGPLAPGATGRFLTAERLPERLLYAEPLRRRVQVMLKGEWIVDTEDVLLLHEPARYPVAWFPRHAVRAELEPSQRQGEHPDLHAADPYHRVDARSSLRRVVVRAVGRVVAEVDRIRGHLSFDPAALDVEIDGVPLDAVTGQAVDPYGTDRDLTPAEGWA